MPAAVARTVQLFNSYPHADSRLAGGFVSRITEQLAASRRFDFRLWSDVQLLPGQDWHQAIQDALAACDLGLLLISPALLNSDYIRDHELTYFLDPSGRAVKPVIPVLLRPVDFKRQNLHGLERLQIFALADPRGGPAKSFLECTTALQKERFVRALYEQIERRLETLP